MQLIAWNGACNYHNINFLDKYLLSIYHVLGIVPGLEYTVNKKTLNTQVSNLKFWQLFWRRLQGIRRDYDRGMQLESSDVVPQKINRK